MQTPFYVAPITQACLDKDLGKVQRLLAEGADPRTRDTYGRTCMFIACGRGCLDIAQFLFCNGAAEDISTQNDEGGTPMMAAFENGHMQTICEWLVSVGAAEDVRKRDFQGYFPMMYADTLKGLQWLCHRGAAQDIHGENGLYPLHAACEKGNLDMVMWMCEAGADVRVVAQDGSTPMMASCASGHLDLAQWLHANGAAEDIHTKDTHGATCMLSVCSSGKLPLAKWLFEVGADIHTKDFHGSTPMMAACRSGKLPLAKWLHEVGADIRLADRDGETPMWSACSYGRVEVARWLFEVGAAPDIYTASAIGQTPLQAAAYGPMALWLILHGAMNGADGHVNAEVWRTIPSKYYLKLSLLRTIKQNNDFRAFLWVRSKRPKRARLDCPLPRELPRELLEVVADFVGVVRGRALRNAREALAALPIPR
jgi:ankyrin repeat protein